MNEVPFSVSAPTDRPDFDIEGGIARRPDTGDGLGLDLLEPEKPVREEPPKEEPAKPNAGRVEGTHGNPAADFDPDAQDKAVQLGLITPAEAQTAKEDFDRMTQGTQEGIYRLSIDRRNDLNRRNAEALMNTNRNRLSVELPAGIEVRQGVEE